MINIAIDGPAGAGKSTISRHVARELGFIYIDTGALYRAVGLNALRLGLDTTSEQQITPSLDKIHVELKFVDHLQRVLLNGEDVSEDIRLPEASMAASNVSAIPTVRAFLLDLQRNIAAKNNCIMDGRDIGTVVLPHAQIKIFLTASAEDRAKRRHKELLKKGIQADYEEVLSDMKIRDHNDSNRAAAPLKPAEDSIIIDTTGNELQQSIEQILDTIRQKLHK